ncbi:NKPD1 protein, partial [Bucco capensis]|nr:NKPD1 protein [Bucco capensis]
AEMEQQESLHHHSPSRSTHGWDFLVLLWYLTFYIPILTENHLRRKNFHFLFIRFSAWQYSGCDKLWAGLVTTLCDNIRKHYGALPLSIYHVLGSRPRVASGFTEQEWRLKRDTCIKIWAFLFILLFGLILLFIAIWMPGIQEHHALKVIGSAITSLSGSGLVLGIFSIVKNLLISEKQKIERLTNSQRFASQLGFMRKIRHEVEVLLDFLAFMEVFERRRLRVVLEITTLESCYPEKIAGVFNAINTLLSNSHAPFIFILAVDPSVIVPCLEQTGCMKGLADNGYLYLNRTVTLPFSIPEMGARSRLEFLKEAMETREDLMYRVITRQLQRRREKCSRSIPVFPKFEEDEVAMSCIHAAFRCLHDPDDVLGAYLPCTGAHVHRIVNTIPITLRLLLHRSRNSQHLFHNVHHLATAAWVVLADRWPCRLSWIIQCLEDSFQSQPPVDFSTKSLWNIYQENLLELSSLREILHNVLSLDGDPELFQSFLARDFPFNVDDAQKFLGVTVNLDYSIRNKMGMLRALDRLQ